MRWPKKYAYQWNDYFCWFPTDVDGVGYVWLETIERKAEGIPNRLGELYYVYRTKD